MRVNDPNLNPAALNSTSANGAASTGKTAQLDPVRIQSSNSSVNQTGERGDEVQLSSLSSKINESQSGSVEREAYLEKLRLEVASGQYEADPQQTAAGIIKDALLKSE